MLHICLSQHCSASVCPIFTTRISVLYVFVTAKTKKIITKFVNLDSTSFILKTLEKLKLPISLNQMGAFYRCLY